MKKAVWISTAAILAGIAVIAVVRSVSEKAAAAQVEVSERLAKEVAGKIAAIKAAEPDAGHRAPQRVEVSSAELESYVQLSLRDDIPGQIDSISITLSDGAAAAEVRITLPDAGGGNPLVDALLGGAHNLFVKGKLSAAEGTGHFDLEGVKVDGIPVPAIFVETLIEKYVKPRFPGVDLRKPFRMPWGIEELTIVGDKATIVY